MVHPDTPSKDNEVAQYRMIGKNSKMQRGMYSMPQSVPCFKNICICITCIEISRR